MEIFLVIVSIVAIFGTFAVGVILILSKTRSEDEIRSRRDSIRNRRNRRANEKHSE